MTGEFITVTLFSLEVSLEISLGVEKLKNQENFFKKSNLKKKLVKKKK